MGLAGAGRLVRNALRVLSRVKRVSTTVNRVSTTVSISGEDRAAMLRPLPGIASELFVPPSREALFLLRHAGWLVSPKTLPGAWPGRFPPH